MRLLCLSVCQPYASALVLGLKPEEYRGWPTAHRGLLGIHAPIRQWEDGYGDYPEIDRSAVRTGVLLGTVRVTGCRDLGGGRFAWEVGSPAAFAEPIPMKGRLRCWPAEVDEAILAGR